MTTTTTVEELILRTDASGAPVRLEYVRGRLKAEASPSSRHQRTVDRIRDRLSQAPSTAGAACGCHSLADTLIRFPDLDHSLKRPDISIFCDEPPDSDEALDIMPQAVIEILSLGYEDKDLGEDGAPFYLGCGVLDVIVVDPRSQQVRHYQAGQPIRELTAPIAIDLQCGCRVRI